ncbi:MAG: tail fiber domain-containing protein [Phycisphaerales bacterium]
MPRITARQTIAKLILAAGIAAATAAPASAQTEFTYQGVLENNGSPVTGTENIRFRVFDAQSGGNLIAETTQNVDVVDGVFTAPLNLGTLNTIDPSSAWLEPAVSLGGGSFDVLGRQKLTAAPFAMNTRGINVSSSGNVGIGLDAARAFEVDLGPDNGTIGFGNGFDMLIDGGADGRFDFTNTFGSGGDTRFLGSGGAANPVMTLQNDGNVGIGVTDPARPLDVAGPISTQGTVMDGSYFEMSMSNTGGGQLVARDLNGNPLNVKLATFGGNVGIGNAQPRAALDILSETVPSGIAVNPNSDLIIDSAFGDASITLVGSKFTEEKTLRFTNEDSETAGAIIVDAFSDSDPDKGSMTFRIGQSVAMNIDDTARVGIGLGFTTPDFLLEVNGSAGKPGGGSWSNSSDERLKKNITKIDGALDTLLALKGVHFEYKDPEAINELPGVRTGFIAQEVETVIPDWISEGDDGFKRMTIRGFEALAVESLREQQEQIAALEARIESMEAQRSVVGASMAWPALLGGGVLGGLVLVRRRMTKA